MLNLVELAGVKEGEQMARLEALAHGAMEAVGIDHYEIGQAIALRIRGVLAQKYTTPEGEEYK